MWRSAAQAGGDRPGEIGARIAAQSGADFTVVRLFALLRDACRTSDWGDEQHGLRVAKLARSS